MALDNVKGVWYNGYADGGNVTFLHHLPYVHRSNGWLPHSWGWRHNLSKKTDLKRSVFFVFCKLPRLQGKPKDSLQRRPSGEEPCPGRARPRRGGTPPPQTARTNEGAPPRTGWPPTWSVSGAVKREAPPPSDQAASKGGGKPRRLHLPRTAPTKHHGGALHEKARPGHRRRAPTACGTGAARGAWGDRREQATKGPPRPRYNKNGSSALCREATFFKGRSPVPYVRPSRFVP